MADSAGNFQSARRIAAISSSLGVQDFPFFRILSFLPLQIIIIIIIFTKHFLALTPAGAESDLNASMIGA